jgi:glycosyltransferase involved in cell wall biosynthesis
MSFQSASTMLDASVIICTHNPRSDYFARVLDGLRNQTLPLHKWELLIVDNASRIPLASSWDVSWHPSARHILEIELGLTPARQRGIQEASSDLIIFVDDDNVLDETYLAEAIKIEEEWPSLGVWGSGYIPGDLEVELPESLRKHRSWLPLREVTTPRWSNLASCEVDALSAWVGQLELRKQGMSHAIPLGAGLCVRKKVALAYRQFCEESSIHISDRQGDSLFSGGDIEISWVCCSHGLGIGIFPELKLTHLIPQHRLSEDYFVRFLEEACFSDYLLDYKWRRIIPQSPSGIKTLLSVLKTILLYRGVDRKMRFAWVRALAKAKNIIEMDLRENNSEICHMAAREPIKALVGAEKAMS